MENSFKLHGNIISDPIYDNDSNMYLDISVKHEVPVKTSSGNRYGQDIIRVGIATKIKDYVLNNSFKGQMILITGKLISFNNTIIPLSNSIYLLERKEGYFRTTQATNRRV